MNESGKFWGGAEKVTFAATAPFRFEFLSSATRSALGFAVRTWLASLLALYLAFVLELDLPSWAAMTVWIVSSPNAGRVLSKGLYRLLGTVIGVLMGVVLMGCFAQSPVLFLLTFALWMGGCTVASNLLRNDRSYASVLAGITAALVALDSINNPSQVFSIAFARGACTALGIVCAMVMTSLLAPHRARKEVLLKLKAVLADTARHAASVLAARPINAGRSSEQKLISDLIALDQQIEYAAAES